MRAFFLAALFFSFFLSLFYKNSSKIWRLVKNKKKGKKNISSSMLDYFVCLFVCFSFSLSFFLDFLFAFFVIFVSQEEYECSGSDSSSSLFQKRISKSSSSSSSNHPSATGKQKMHQHGATGSSATTSTRGTFVSAPLLPSGRRCRHRLLDRRRGRRRRAEEENVVNENYFTITNKTTSISSSSSHNEGVTSKSAITKRVEESVNLPPPRISDLPRAPNERVASVLRSAIPGDLLLITTVGGGRKKTRSVPSSQENSTIRNSAIERTRTFRASEKEEEEKEEEEEEEEEEESSSSESKDRRERWFVVRESTAAAAEDNENNAVITLKGEIQGKNVTITLDTSKQSNNMEAELDVREDSCFTNDAWMNQLGEKFRVELKSSKLKSKNFERMKNLQRASKVVGCRSVVSYDLLKAAVKNDASPWRDGKSASTRRCIVEGLEPATQLAGELLAFEEKCRDVVMIQVSHSSELAPAGHLFYDAKEENKHDQNLRDYLERKRAAEFSGGGGPTNSSGSPGSPSSPSSSSSSKDGNKRSSEGGWNLFGSLFGSSNNGNTANAGKKVMTLNAVWEPSQLQTIDAPYVLQTLHRIALENPDDVGFLSSNLKVDENSVKSVSLIMYRKSVPGAKERAEKLSSLRTQAAFNEQDWSKRIAVGSLLGYSRENTIWHAKGLIDRHLVTPGDIQDAFDNALDIDEN